MNLQELRKAINTIDASILKLIGERMDLCKKMRPLKGEIEDTKRESELREIWLKEAESLGISRDAALAILAELFKESKRIQRDSSQDT
ncbi:MAG: chorismate mutase [Patescibacteria group bacterium]